MTFWSVVYADVQRLVEGGKKICHDNYQTCGLSLSAAAVEIAHFCLQDGHPLHNIQDIIFKGSLARWPTFAKYISRLFLFKAGFHPNSNNF